MQLGREALEPKMQAGWACKRCWVRRGAVRVLLASVPTPCQALSSKFVKWEANWKPASLTEQTPQGQGTQGTQDLQPHCTDAARLSMAP